MYIELNFLAGLIGGIIIGMVIIILLVFIVCMTAIGYLRSDEDEEENQPNMGYSPEMMEGPPIGRELDPSNQEEGYPNMESFTSEKGYAPEDPIMHTETFSQFPTEQQMEQDENAGVNLEKPPVQQHVVRETFVNEDGLESPVVVPDPEIIEE